MMKRFALLLFMTMNAFVLLAQNHFVYVRYSPKDGNVSPVISHIEQIRSTSSSQMIVFISHALAPIIVTQDKEWQNARDILLSMQVEYDYYPLEEASLLNSCFSQYFKEVVTSDLHIQGEEDRNWVVTYIVSEDMLQSNDFEYLAENIYVNELINRMDVNILTYNEFDNELSLVNFPKNMLFQFNN